MDVVRLVIRAKAGDVDAFTDLVKRYQAMALGYAYTNLGDFHLAEDAVQQAFIAAYKSLSRLEQPERFGAWLRGIVRFECLRILRSRKSGNVSIGAATELSSSVPGPAELVEERAGFERVLAA